MNTRAREVIWPSGEVVTRTFDFADFDAIRISDVFTATIEQAPDYRVELHVDRNVLDHVQIQVVDGLLSVGLDDDISVRGRFRHQVHIALPALRELEVSGASDVTMAGIEAPGGELVLGVSGASKLRGDAAGRELTIAVSGASEMEADAAAIGLSIDLSGASRLTLDGTARSVTIAAAGASRLHLEGLQAETMEIELSGASSAHVAVSETLGPARLSGASSLRYSGDPALREIHTSGASTVAPR